MKNQWMFHILDWIDPATSSRVEGELPSEMHRHVVSRIVPFVFLLGIVFESSLDSILLSNRYFITTTMIVLLLGTGLVGFCLHHRQLAAATLVSITLLMGLALWIQSFHLYTMPYLDNTLIILLFPIGIAGFVYGNRGVVLSCITGFGLSFVLIPLSDSTILPHLWAFLANELFSICVFLGIFMIGMNTLRGFLLSSYSQSWQQTLKAMLMGVDDHVLNLEREILHSHEALQQSLQRTQMREKYLDSVIDHIAPDGFIVCDVHGMILRCNDGQLAMIGLEREMVIGKHFSQLYADEEEYKLHVQETLEQVMLHGHCNVECKIRSGTDTVLYVDINVAWIPDLNQYIVISRDVSERHIQQEEIIRQLEETQKMRDEFFTILDALDDGIVFYSPLGQEIFRNRANAKQMDIQPLPGRTLKQVVAMNKMCDIDGATILLEKNPVYRVLQGEAIVHERLRIVHNPQEVRLMESMSYSVSNSLTGNQGVLVLMRDITDQMRIEQYNATLRAIVHACAASTDLKTLVQSTLLKMRESLNLSTVVISIPDVHRPGFAMILGIESIHDEWEKFIADTLPAETIAEYSTLATLRVMKTGKPIFHFEMVPSKMVYTTSTGCTLKPSLLYAVPLVFNAEIIGTLTLIRDIQRERDVFDAIDPSFIQAIGEELSTSLHRVQMYEEAVRYSTHDILTGLWNHRELQVQLQESIAFRMFLGLPLSLMMIDIDHFHHFNVKFGHTQGDVALKTLSDIIISELGDKGFAARYSGEEFAVVLPDIDYEYCSALAEHIRSVVEANQVNDLHLTVSIGFATFPNHASASASLIKASEIALHAAKRSGRNSVVGYTSQLLQDGIPGVPLKRGELFEMQLPSGADLETVQALVAAVDLRDGYTASHSSNVSRYAVSLGMMLMLPTEQIEALRLGGLIHDVGKIGVSDQILRKPGKLTEEEWAIMMKHPIMGEEIVRSIEPLRHLLPLIRWHHERLDGSGYPDGLCAEQIPFLVRVLSVADIFDAFTAERPYHLGRTPIAGMQLLRSEALAGRLDTVVVNAMEQILQSQGLLERIDLEMDLDAA